MTEFGPGSRAHLSLACHLVYLGFVRSQLESLHFFSIMLLFHERTDYTYHIIQIFHVLLPGSVSLAAFGKTYHPTYTMFIVWICIW